MPLASGAGAGSDGNDLPSVRSNRASGRSYVRDRPIHRWLRPLGLGLVAGRWLRLLIGFPIVVIATCVSARLLGVRVRCLLRVSGGLLNCQRAGA
jgi:hypothetical protein